MRIIRIPAYLDSYWGILLREKRQLIRLNKQVSVVCKVAEKKGDVHHLFTKDLSGEGICIKVPEILPEGTLLDLTINAPDSKPILLKGEVAWVKKVEEMSAGGERLFDTGIRFIKVDPKDKDRFKKFLQTALKEAGINE
jgi:hypothetical protein